MATSVDCHVHVESALLAERLLSAMDAASISTSILLGSSRFTITLHPKDGFTAYEGNNRELLAARRIHPDRFEVWPTLDPLADDNIKRLEGYMAEGASGVKLYAGHGFCHGDPPCYLFHTTPLDSDPLLCIYNWCNANRIPICLHVNTTDAVPGLRQQFENVLRLFPALRLIVPHWLLATRRPAYLRSIFQNHPNVLTDVSFGQDNFLEAGFRRISGAADWFSTFVQDFSDRILCGSDIVCTNAPFKTVEWMALRMAVYRNMLTCREYFCPISRKSRRGLDLPGHALSKVLSGNAERLLSRYQVKSRIT